MHTSELPSLIYDDVLIKCNHGNTRVLVLTFHIILLRLQILVLHYFRPEVDGGFCGSPDVGEPCLSLEIIWKHTAENKLYVEHEDVRYRDDMFSHLESESKDVSC